jgi:hypothetical protein
MPRLEEIASQIARLWCEKITLASQRKFEEFGKYAKECRQYYARSNYDEFLYVEDFDIGDVTPKVTINKCFEMVEVFLPYLHHQNPTRLISDRRPEIPPELWLSLVPPEQLQAMAQQLAAQGMPPEMIQQQILQAVTPQDPKAPLREIRRLLLEPYLNWNCHEQDLAGESIRSLTEALVDGRGVWWIETIEGPNGRTAGAFHDSVEYLQIDPDGADYVRNSLWCARQRWWPRWKLEDHFGMARDELKGCETDESHARQAAVNIEGQEDNRRNREKRGETYDMVEWFQVYSRCGIGHHLQGFDDDLREMMSGSQLNDYVYLALCPGYDAPLNFRPDMLNVPPEARAEARQSVIDGLQWPTPFFKNSSHPWPFVHCDFHHQKQSVWPISHMRPALGIQKLICWIWSHVALHVSKTSQGRWLIDDRLNDEQRDQLASRVDEALISVHLQGNQRLAEMAMHLQAPEMNKDIWQLAMALERMYEMATGVNELLTRGTVDRQMRSAQEASVIDKHSGSRAEALAGMYDDCQSRIASQVATAIRYHVDGREIAQHYDEKFDDTIRSDRPVQYGPLTTLWMRAVYSDDIDAIVAENDYRIESGSMRKPNVGELGASLAETAPVVVGLLDKEWSTTGNPNNLNNWFKDFTKVHNMADIVFPDMEAMIQQQMMAAQQQPQQGPPQSAA